MFQVTASWSCVLVKPNSRNLAAMIGDMKSLDSLGHAHAGTCFATYWQRRGGARHQAMVVPSTTGGCIFQELANNSIDVSRLGIFDNGVPFVEAIVS